MALESGNYTILCQLDSAFVGRSEIEPQDTSPKPIFKLSSSTTSVSTSGVSHRQSRITNFLLIETVCCIVLVSPRSYMMVPR